jgi:hypothetical protein
MEAVLTEKGYYDVMTPTDHMDTDDPERLARSKKAIAYIRLALSDGPLLQTRHITDPCLLWDKLKALYEPKGFSSEFLICKELFETTLSGLNNSIEDYLNRIKRLTDDLAARNLAIPNKVIAAWTLNNLTADYENTVAMISQSIRTSQSQVDLDQLFAQLVDESRRLKSKEDKEMALNSKTYSGGPNSKDGPRKTKRTCNHCKKSGHIEEKCWIKHPALKTQKESNKDKESQPEEVALISQTEAALHTEDPTSEDTIDWILDSGATSHICSDKRLFTSLEPHKIALRWGSAGQLYTSGIGTVKVQFSSTNQKAEIGDVLYVPELGVNLLSLGVLVEKGLNVIFNSKTCLIRREKTVIAEGRNQRKIPIFQARFQRPTRANALYTVKDPYIWHERLGHIGPAALENLPKAVTGCEFDKTIKTYTDNCEICIKAKTTATISRKPSTPSTTYLELVHSDLCGPIAPQTIGGRRYIATFIDSATKWAEISLLRTKNEVFSAFKEFRVKEEKQTGKTLKRLHSDHGTEYKSDEFVGYLKKEGILYTYSAPYAHEQNGNAERFNRTLLNKVRALLFSSNLPKKYWGEAATAANYIYNRTPHSAIEFKTPYEAKYGTKPDISNIRIWGSIAHKKEEIRRKLDPKTKEFILVGYGSNQYRLLNPKTGKITWARDLKIVEKPHLTSIDQKESIEKSNSEELTLEEENQPEMSKPEEPELEQPNLEEPKLEEPKSEESKTEDFKLDLEEIRRLGKGIPQQFLDELIEAAAFIAENDPITYQDAKNSPNWPKWLEAMNIEIEYLKSQETWTLVKAPENRKILKGRWVYKTKLNADGTIEKYKARWVVKGFLQLFGLDYTETFANTIKNSAFRALFAIAALLDYEIDQWDIKSAFPNAPIDEDIYVQQPIGYETEKGLVYKLNKALYGLK